MKHAHALAAALAVAPCGSTTGPHAPFMLIVHVLVDKIRSGELKPGDRVPSVTELVRAYDVSHSTARRALAKLKEMGLTDTVPGYATFVRFPDQDSGTAEETQVRALEVLRKIDRIPQGQGSRIRTPQVVDRSEET